MTYAIIDAGGKQIWIQAGRFYDLNYIKGEPGDVINLNRVLLINQEGNIRIGTPCIKSITIQAKILKHLKSKKITILKMKPKKNYRRKQGHRQQLTRLLIQDIST
uniref:50S ribosomal protein L21, chloroplastic n=1 Tax=Mastocarpus papillatus TaxID=31436 RepID=A0A342RZA3_9FLOR|nr:ribosomal protein L21 [Mastocarpus papillatus]AOL58049.1 ribosomal protein L21 [Mastocarpus papillatus]